MSTHNTCFLQEIKKIYSHNLDTLLSFEVLVPGQVNWNFLLVHIRETGQVGQVRHGISTALHTGIYSTDISIVYWKQTGLKNVLERSSRCKFLCSI